MRRRGPALCLAALLAASACARLHELLPPVADAGDGAVETDASEPHYTVDGGVYVCGDRICACSDGRDNEPQPDDLVDGFDPECTGPYDDDEATFATGEKEGNPRCIDCFFDGDPSSGNDDCRIPTSCRDEGDASGGFGMCDSCTPSAACVTNCVDRTPNGCDCFGCCLIEDGNQTRPIQLKKTCSMAVISDAMLCPSCVPNTNVALPDGRACFNPCGDCELCPGRTADELPPECAQFALGYDCEDAVVCGEQNALCPPNTAWCLQGCCAPLLN